MLGPLPAFLRSHIFGLGRVHLLSRSKRTVLLFTADAAASGANRVVLDLAAGLRSTHQVVCLCLREGPWSREFRGKVDGYISLSQNDGTNPDFMRGLIARLCKRLRIDFAVVHSIPGWPAFPGLVEQDIPSLLYVQDFPSDNTLAERMIFAAFSAGTILFSAPQVLAAALQGCPGLEHCRSRIVPFGSQGDDREGGAAGLGISSFTDRIRALAEEVVAAKAQEVLDRKILSPAGVLDPGMRIREQRPLSHSDYAVHYCRAWASGMHPRKPLPGFHPGIYRDHTPGCRRDPYVHWLEQGKPPGPWTNRVIIPEESSQAREPGMDCGRVALHLHVFYPDLVGDIIARLNRNQFRPDLLVSVSEVCDVSGVAEQLQAYGGRWESATVPNRGRDIGPWITVYGQRVVRDYDLVGHIHTKKTLWHPDPDLGRRWREFMLENMVGGRHAMVDRIVAELVADEDLGLIFPEYASIGQWDGMRESSARLMERLGLQADLPAHFNFPMGSFFWAKTKAIQPWLECGFTWEDYPEEPIPNNGTILHMLEGIVSRVAEQRGFRYDTTHIRGLGW